MTATGYPRTTRIRSPEAWEIVSTLDAALDVAGLVGAVRGWEIEYDGALLWTTATIWTDTGRTTKVADVSRTLSGALVTELVVTVYDDDGATVLAEVTDAATYDGAILLTVERTVA